MPKMEKIEKYNHHGQSAAASNAVVCWLNSHGTVLVTLYIVAYMTYFKKYLVIQIFMYTRTPMTILEMDLLGIISWVDREIKNHNQPTT